MLTAKQAKDKARLFDPEWKEILEKLKDKIEYQTENYPEEKEFLFNMEDSQEYSDDVIEHLETLGYEASWNDSFLAVEINFKNA